MIPAIGFATLEWALWLAHHRHVVCKAKTFRSPTGKQNIFQSNDSTSLSDVRRCSKQGKGLREKQTYGAHHTLHNLRTSNTQTALESESNP